jgi:chemotaxis protein methyltransferase CheR
MLSSPPLPGVDDARAFSQAIVDTIREPLLVLDKDLRVLVASRSFCSAFQVKAEDTQGLLIHEIGGGEWDIAPLRALLAHIAPDDSVIEGYEVDHDFPRIGQRVMLLNARKVFYERQNTSSILLAIEDITARRLAERERDDLMRQKDMLLGEMEHRVANSLQIIASILLMKARNVNSEETRAHLHDAHNRVLAVAAVQRHLHAATGAEAVKLAPYLQQLCASLAGAMIHDGIDATQVEVEVGSGSTSSANAVSLGLIVTELVINALKHAFPAPKAGAAITVSFVPGEADWTLSVSDNGVGREHRGPTRTKSGLGTSIVAALAEQLRARVVTVSSAAGTNISVIGAHTLEAA